MRKLFCCICLLGIFSIVCCNQHKDTVTIGHNLNTDSVDYCEVDSDDLMQADWHH